MCFAKLGPVLDTLEYLRCETSVWLEITSLLIPGANDSDAEIDAMTRWVAGHLGPDVPVHFTAFHPDFKMLDRPPTPPQTLARARRIATANGIRYPYTGNVYDTAGQSTCCHGCGRPVIERDWYRLGGYRLTGDGHCAGWRAHPRRIRRAAGMLGIQTGARPAGLVQVTRPRERDGRRGTAGGPAAGSGGDLRRIGPGATTCVALVGAGRRAGPRPGAAARAVPKALIVPHAGYAYSGAAAAAGYGAISAADGGGSGGGAAGPSHYVPGGGPRGEPVTRSAPLLGTVPVDRQAGNAVCKVRVARRPACPMRSSTALRFRCRSSRPPRTGSPGPHRRRTGPATRGGGGAGAAGGRPGDADRDQHRPVHSLGYQAAAARDRRTARAILALGPSPIGDADACGARPLRGVLLAAARNGMRASLLDLRNSGGSVATGRVVGYGAFALGSTAPPSGSPAGERPEPAVTHRLPPASSS